MWGRPNASCSEAEAKAKDAEAERAETPAYVLLGHPLISCLGTPSKRAFLKMIHLAWSFQFSQVLVGHVFVERPTIDVGSNHR